jgi:hypothetical protein
MGVEVNWTAVVVAAVASMAVGALWYSPVLFANAWMKEIGKKKEDISGAGPAYALTTVFALVTSYVFWHFLKLVGVVDMMGALTVAFWAWVGFVAPAFGAEYLFAGKTKVLYGITVGHHLVSLLAIAAVQAYFLA